MSGVVTASLLKDPAPRGHEEDALQRSVVKYLAWALPADATFWHTPNGGLRSKVSAAKLVPMGVRAGVPDIEVVYQGRAIFFELKAAKGGLSAHQRQFHNKLRYCGAQVITCRSINCVEESLREFGVPLKARLT